MGVESGKTEDYVRDKRVEEDLYSGVDETYEEDKKESIALNPWLFNGRVNVFTSLYKLQNNKITHQTKVIRSSKLPINSGVYIVQPLHIYIYILQTRLSA